jgi:hypothetical protein
MLEGLMSLWMIPLSVQFLMAYIKFNRVTVMKANYSHLQELLHKLNPLMIVLELESSMVLFEDKSVKREIFRMQDLQRFDDSGCPFQFFEHPHFLVESELVGELDNALPLAAAITSQCNLSLCCPVTPMFHI